LLCFEKRLLRLLPGTPTAWDGLGPPPTETAQPTEYRPRKNARPKKEIIIGSIGNAPADSDPRPQSEEAWAQQEAADWDADAKLTKQLIICRNCLPEPALDDATGRTKR